MSESEVSSRCPKCQGSMIQGFVLDHTYGGQSLSSWGQGEPTKSFWTGIKASHSTVPIGAFRCERCGFLEFYARHKFAAQ